MMVIGATSPTAGEADSPAMWSHLIHLNESLKAETVV